MNLEKFVTAPSLSLAYLVRHACLDTISMEPGGGVCSVTAMAGQRHVLMAVVNALLVEHTYPKWINKMLFLFYRTAVAIQQVCIVKSAFMVHTMSIHPSTYLATFAPVHH